MQSPSQTYLLISYLKQVDQLHERSIKQLKMGDNGLSIKLHKMMLQQKQGEAEGDRLRTMSNDLTTLQIYIVFYSMQNEKSWGVSTKSSSNYINSPLKDASHIKAFMLEEAKERESTFLRQKNQELQDLVLRMGEEIMKINKDKKDLLALNSKYIDTLNKQFKQNHVLFDQIKINENLPKNCSTCKCKILLQFQSDYRNLVRHCIDLEQQINCKNADICELQQMKSELMRSNHTCISELIEELIDTTHELVTLKKSYNKLEFDLQKITQKHEKMQQSGKETQKAASSLAYELENYKSIINTITNEANDKENSFKAKIYSLELTIQKLEKDVRETQNKNEFISAKNSILKAEQIQLLQQGLQQKGGLKKSRIVRSQSMQKPRKK